jgi:hypothetical protein
MRYPLRISAKTWILTTGFTWNSEVYTVAGTLSIEPSLPQNMPLVTGQCPFLMCLSLAIFPSLGILS